MNADPTIAEMVLLHREVILRYFRAHGAGDHADDLLQDLWIKAHRSVRPGDISRSYVMTMAHNVVIDHARSARQRGVRDDRWHAEGPTSGSADPSPDVERSLIARDRLRKVEEVLTGLGARTERILRSHRLTERSQKQIAADEGLSLSAVEKHLQKAYRALAAVRLDADGGDHGR